MVVERSSSLSLWEKTFTNFVTYETPGTTLRTLSLPLASIVNRGVDHTSDQVVRHRNTVLVDAVVQKLVFFFALQ